MQVLLYAPAITPRLEYICAFIFKERLLTDPVITSSREAFENFEGIKISYDNQAISADHLTIGNCGLLFENDIRKKDIHCFETNDYKAFFPAANADLPFDLLSACFYLLSRYEEYLPHQKDMYGRYAHENSLAFKENFLQLPLVDLWIGELLKRLQKKFSGVNFHRPPFKMVPTYDIDMAFSFRHKGWLRNLAGFVRSPSINRIKVLRGLSKDPFDAFEWMDKLHSRHHLQPLYFFLMAEKNGRYDKNILPHKKAMLSLLKQQAQRYKIGIHPSWQSGSRPALLIKEKERLSEIIEKPVSVSRQHYIRFELPTGYRRLIDAGITDDYSMGYGSVNGFRASAASSFYWFDLQKNEATTLRIHPFCFMDANSFYEQRFTAAQAADELMHYYEICKKAQAQLVMIWHNNFLGTDPVFAGWRNIYEHLLTESGIEMNNQ